MTSSSLEDNIFELLGAAKKIESNGGNDKEAATKYYEAVYLMRRFVERLPWTPQEEPKRKLMQQKMEEYEKLAEDLLCRASSRSRSTSNQFTTVQQQKHSIMNGQQPTAAKKPMISVMDQQRSHGIFLDSSTRGSYPKRGGESNNLNNNSQNLNTIHRLVNQATTKLGNALDLDESGQLSLAVQAYMEAAELYLQALQLAKSPTTKEQQQQRHYQSSKSKEVELIPLITKRIESTLDRVEQLKNPDRIRSNITTLDPKTHNQKQNNASKKQSLTPEEVSVLMESSTTVSGLFLPWSDEDAAALSNEAIKATQSQQPMGRRFTDPDGFLKLSDQQKVVFSKWARPDEIVHIRHRTGLSGGGKQQQQLQKPILIHAITPYSIKQQYVTDCSFIASLCVTAAFERRLRKTLITSIIFPQSPDGRPFYNPLGKYMVKLWLNGVARCVVVDDLLPIDRHGNVLCSHSTKPTSPYFELWVCLIEKAYLKLCGGYDFPGSNSGVDLFSLTGWIPERVHFTKNADKVRDYEILPERAWERIASASSFGDCLITVSSHLNMSKEEADQLGLVMGHAYAVLSVIETSKGVRLLQLKNPWALKGWKGRYSAHDVEAWKDREFRSEVGYDPDKARNQDDGIFWICWDDILNYFQNFHLSWNPFLFSFRTIHHGLWPKDQGPYDDTFNAGENPQYILTLSDQAIEQKASIWILISRHVSKQEQEGADVSDFLTVHVHRNTGQQKRIWYPGRSGNCVLNGAYTNNPHVLVRYDVTGQEDKNLSLVLSQYQKTNDLRYTLSVYSTKSFLLSKPRPSLPHLLNRSGRLNPEGGPLGSNLITHNPMFSLVVPRDMTAVELRLSTAKNIALNIIILPVKKAGQRVDQAVGPPIIDTGNYRHGFLVVNRTTMKAGTYVIMISCYTRKQEGNFELVCTTSQPVELQALQ